MAVIEERGKSSNIVLEQMATAVNSEAADHIWNGDEILPAVSLTSDY